ncbi:tetratricopeptide repeat protein [Chitinimonas naiadis]
MRTRPFSVGLLLWAALGFPVLTSITTSPAVVMAESDTVRPEVGKPLQAASGLLKSGKYKEALAKINEAAAAPNKSGYETFVVDRMRGFAAAGAGDAQLAAKSLESAMGSGKMSGAEKLSAMEALVSAFYRAKDYNSTAVWANRYAKEGGTNSQITGLIPQLRYMSGDFAATAKDLQAQVNADEKAGRTPAKDKLQLLANCYLKLSNTDGYIGTLEKLVAHYPDKSVWTDIINRLQRKSGFADRLALDVYRLKLATGNLVSANDYMEMAQLALQEGFNAEGKKIVDQAFSSNVFGSGAEAERQKRLRDLANKRLADEQKTQAQTEKDATAAADGSQLVSVGMNYVGAGQAAKGIALIEQGIAKGNLKRPDDAKLRLGIAYQIAGQKAKAIQTLKTVKGTDGTADLARLWTYYAQQR